MNFNSALQYAGIAAEIIVLGLMLRKGLWRTLPIFCALVGCDFFSDTLNAIIQQRNPDLFLKTYFWEMGVSSLLQFAVLIELAWSVLRPSRASLPRAALPVLAVLVALAGLVIWPLAGTAVPPNLTPHAQLFFHFQGTISILRVVCFLVMAGFSQILAIGWKDRELQVATGLGFFSIISLLVSVLHSHQMWQDASYTLLDRVQSISYLGTLTYWGVSFATKEQERKEFSPQMQQFLLLMSGGARAGRIALSDLPPERPRKRIK